MRFRLLSHYVIPVDSKNTIKNTLVHANHSTNLKNFHVWKYELKAVLGIWDVYSGIPHLGSEFFPSRIPDPGLKRSRIRINEWSIFNPKTKFSKNWIRDVHPGFRGQKSTGSRIRNTAQKEISCYEVYRREKKFILLRFPVPDSSFLVFLRSWISVTNRSIFFSLFSFSESDFVFLVFSLWFQRKRRSKWCWIPS